MGTANKIRIMSHEFRESEMVTTAQVYAVVMRNTQVFCKAEGRIMLLM